MRRREALVLMAAAGAMGASPEPRGLDALRWKRRVVIVFAPLRDDPRLARQRGEVERLTRAADDRDLLLIEVASDHVTPGYGDAASLRHRFHVDADAFEALLIGKDGGVKLRSGEVIPAERLIDTIDAMPMRRDEAARRPGR